MTQAASTAVLPEFRTVISMGKEAAALIKTFPPRPQSATWPTTAASREAVLDQLRLPAFQFGQPNSHKARLVGARVLLQWLETFPGDSWQRRWDACPSSPSAQGWASPVQAWAPTIGRNPTGASLRAGMLLLICADVIRPSLRWLMDNSSRHLRPSLESVRDPEGFRTLLASRPPHERDTKMASEALKALARIMAASGGNVSDIVVGDVLALLQEGRDGTTAIRLAYAWLRERGQFPANAPATLHGIKVRNGQLSPTELVDRYNLQCKPIRDLIVAYLAERQTAVDFNSLVPLSMALAKLFWADLERHHPGIDSLRLPREVSDAWKARIAVKSVAQRKPDGTTVMISAPRGSAASVKSLVRTFYLDIAQWAVDEPERWGLWAAPSPLTEADCSVKKMEQDQKVRMDRRTRERLPVLPALVRTAKQQLDTAKTRLELMDSTALGAEFTALGETFTLPLSTGRSDGKPAFAMDGTGRRRHLRAEEKKAFWGWATVEILRHTGIRIEELLELGHHSIISYKLPSTGEVVPLLQIAPSKTDQERLLLVTPELADVLSTVVMRVRGKDGAVPLVSSYDSGERVWNPPMPLLYQWQTSGTNRSVSENVIRASLKEMLAASGITDNSGAPLNFQPHDFRRIFITDSILNGLPPHIAQVIAGHGNINTTMGYAAIYPTDAIEAHRAFIARRRSLRPSEEYRSVTAEEWEEFLGHFERRKLALGQCGRAFGTDCQHEHACVRCPVLIVSPEERPRLEEIRDNLSDRIAEAEREGWLGEIEGLQVSRAGAEEKLAHLDAEQLRRKTVDLGIPTFNQIAARIMEGNDE
ncbi:site-specific integrase [Streptomyces sp. NPDC002785]|uniref:site-specific integrase n=1 Tax=Streptomyces sp. NPDC002785 TaxID=3154543 RepID=UPI00331E2F4E